MGFFKDMDESLKALERRHLMRQIHSQEVVKINTPELAEKHGRKLGDEIVILKKPPRYTL